MLPVWATVAREEAIRLPIQTTVLSIADAVAGAAGILRRPLDAHELMALAERRTGMHDFGDRSFVEPLERLLRASGEEASLSLIGRVAARWDVVRLLSNLLQFRDAERRDHGILAERIERPIFITGLPRSGTTFLHRLVIEDPENRAPFVWQTIYPYPLASRKGH